MPLMKRRFLFEADDDEGTDAGGTEGNAAAEDNGGNNDTQNDDSGGDEPTDDTTESEEQPDQNSENEDYDIDTEPDPEEDTGDEGTGDDSGDMDGGDSADSSTETEEKELDRELFDSLSEGEKKRKISTLKKLYSELYDKCNVLIEKFNQMANDDNEEFKPVIKRILSILYDLKEYVSYYILKVYDDTSYIENDINFNRYLSILNGIKLTVEELQKIKEKNKEEGNK